MVSGQTKTERSDATPPPVFFPELSSGGQI